MSKIIDFPSHPEGFRKKSELADYLRKMADYIEDSYLEYPPVSIAMIFTSEKYHEMMQYGYDSKYAFKDALNAASSYASCSYKRRGGALFERKV
ncbi:hypothetical protein [Candidatus Sororendozoicomonas aggregata]|uniref:hypothetical protein n=1 Tax=Candidatus Sororendozoicomonas aggregata TaxID=3073239 RepID=UPI002ED69D20